MNRILLCLSLASNRITDKGAMKFGELLSRFPLTHEEVVERRKLLRDKGSPDRGSGKSVSYRKNMWTNPAFGLRG